MRLRAQNGITLLETMLYIAIVAIVMPAFILFITQIWQQESGHKFEIRIEQSTSLLFLELSHAITESDAIMTSTSTLGTNPSILRFKDANGTIVTLDRVTTTVAYASGDQTINRLRLTRGSEAAIWLTEPEVDVSIWRVDPVRNSTNVLTGVRMNLELGMLNASNNAYRHADFAADTTLALSPHTLEQ